MSKARNSNVRRPSVAQPKFISINIAKPIIKIDNKDAMILDTLPETTQLSFREEHNQAQLIERIQYFNLHGAITGKGKHTSSEKTAAKEYRIMKNEYLAGKLIARFNLLSRFKTASEMLAEAYRVLKLKTPKDDNALGKDGNVDLAQKNACGTARKQWNNLVKKAIPPVGKPKGNKENHNKASGVEIDPAKYVAIESRWRTSDERKTWFKQLATLIYRTEAANAVLCIGEFREAMETFRASCDRLSKEVPPVGLGKTPQGATKNLNDELNKRVNKTVVQAAIVDARNAELEQQAKEAQEAKDRAEKAKRSAAAKAGHSKRFKRASNGVSLAAAA